MSGWRFTFEVMQRNVWFQGLQAPFSKTHLVLWAAQSLCPSERFRLHRSQERIPHTQKWREGRVGTLIYSWRSGREEERHAMNKNDCKPQNKPVFTAGISTWSNPQSHLCPKIRVYFDVTNRSWRKTRKERKCTNFLFPTNNSKFFSMRSVCPVFLCGLWI